MRKLTIKELNRPSLEEFKKTEKIGLVIILDNIRSLNNIGSVFRTSDAFLVEKVFLCGISTPPPHPEIHKTALGAEDSVEWEYCTSPMDAISRLSEEGWTIVGIEQVEKSIMLGEFIPDKGKKYALILGNEVKGVMQEAIDQCDFCLEIPQQGTKHSLNISVSAGIVIWHFYSRMME
ncbi:RNA methyltransferase [Williamwhitmania taraxaci]|nr:RNA methyltransferase [Williamwhitmania taraxaci]